MHLSRTLILVASVAAFGCGGCGGDDKKPAAGGNAPAAGGGGGAPAAGGGGAAPAAGGSYDASKGTAVLKGTIKFKGEKPAQDVWDTSSEKRCDAHGKVVKEMKEVNEDSSLPHAFVYAAEGPSLGMKGYADPKVVVDQMGCAYLPHVFGAVAGFEVAFKNSDDFNHNVHVKGKRNDGWNKVQSPKQTDMKKFEKEMNDRVVCDVHSWMGSWMHVMEHPFFSTSARGNGAFEIKGLYPGKHKFKVWHETWAKDKPVEFEIELKAGENVHDVEIEAK